MKLFGVKEKVAEKASFLLDARRPKVAAKVSNTSVAYGTLGPTQSRSSFQPSEYNLGEISKVMDIESYVRQAFNKHVELCLKEGYDISSRDEKATSYIKRRLKEMADVSGVTFDMLLRSIATNLVAYSNAFITKVRDSEKSSGSSIRKTAEESLPPVAAYFPMDPTSIQIKRDYHGRVLKYLQRVPGNPIMPQFLPENIVHFHYNKKEGFAFGTPYVVPVLDDIRSLRRLEENVEMLISQNLFPLYQYIVGTENSPAEIYEDGTTEVDVVKNQIERMPTEGSIVTPERHDIKVLGADGKAMDAEKYLKYFEKRVLAGLGMSDVALGRGDTSNRACYSEDTETLTDNGWKMYWEVTENDRIATYNPQNNNIEFHFPDKNIYLYDYNGKMFYFKNSLVDVMVTPDHDMWVGYESNGSKDFSWKKEKSDKIRTKRFKFRTGGLSWSGESPEYFRLPFVTYKSNISFSNSKDFGSIKIEDWVEFLGYFATEGCLAKGSSRWAVTLSQSSVVNPDKTKKIRDCLNRLPFTYNEYTNNGDGTTRFWINCKSLYLYLLESCGDYSYKKHFPEDVLEYDVNLLKILFESAMLGDGTTDKRDGRTSRAFYSSSEVLIGQMQEIAIKLGYRANVVPGTRCQRLLISEHSVSTLTNDNVSVVDYVGKVFCFNVPNHLFITRRNGKIGIHGNTAATLDKVMTDRCKDYQDVIESFVNEYMFKELLNEGGFITDEKEDTFVKLKFREIDIDSMLKIQNHAVFKYEHHAISETEMREELTMDPVMDSQRENMYFDIISKPTMKLEAEIKEAGAKDTNNRQKPANQHGSKPAKTSQKKDYSEITAMADSEWNLLRNAVVTVVSSPDVGASVTLGDLKPLADECYGRIMSKSAGYKINKEMFDSCVKDSISDMGDLVVKNASSMTHPGNAASIVSGVFETLRFRIIDMCEKVVLK